MVFKFPFTLKFKVRVPGKLQFSVKEHSLFNAGGICGVQYMQKKQKGSARSVVKPRVILTI